MSNAKLITETTTTKDKQPKDEKPVVSRDRPSHTY